MSDYRRIRIRRATSGEWMSSNPILAMAEPGYEHDTRRLKVGDGASSWSGLPYFKTDLYGQFPVLSVGDGSQQKFTVNLSTNERLNIVGSGDTNILYDNINKKVIISSTSVSDYLTYNNIVAKLGYVPQPSGAPIPVSQISGLQSTLNNYSLNTHNHILTIGNGSIPTIQYGTNETLNIKGSGSTDIHFNNATNTITVASMGVGIGDTFVIDGGSP
jgi:hypothetical protein